MGFRHCNCIVVFDKNKEKLLFCKRAKNPYKGLLNFVGGKVEPEETSEHAAYRELFEETGISKKDIIVDVLTMSISTDGQAANTTLNAVAGIREQFGGKTILGVSNVSFGLPNRDYINATFFANAMERGLSAAIMNPNSLDMLKAYYAFCALKGYDDRCVDYVEFATVDAPKMMPVTSAVAGNASTVTVNANATSGNANGDADATPLMQSIVKGMKDVAVGATKQELADGKDAFDVIQNEIIPALDVVGKGFEKKTISLLSVNRNKE